MKDGMGIRMHGDEDEVSTQVSVAKESEKGVNKSGMPFVALLIFYMLAVTAAGLYGELKSSKKRIEALSRESFGEVARSKPMTLEEVAAEEVADNHKIVSACMLPEQWYDEYCVVGGNVWLCGYRYLRLTPETYEALKHPSKFVLQWQNSERLCGRAHLILYERREKACEASASPERK